MKSIKYLVKGWYMLDGKTVPFKKLITDTDMAVGYLELMSYRDDANVHTKVDSIECIWNAD